VLRFHDRTKAQTGEIVSQAAPGLR
jgi:hypothetical protein